MKILLPLSIDNCQSDCIFYHADTSTSPFREFCTFSMRMEEIDSRKSLVENDCPLIKFEVKLELKTE